MSSKRETTIANSVADFKTLITTCKSYGSKYNPSKTGLEIASMENLYQRTSASMAALKTAKRPHENAVIHRKSLFASLRKLTSRIQNAFDITDAAAAKKEDVAAEVRRIQGRRAPGASAPQPGLAPEDAPKTVSTSQMGFVNRAANFRELISILESEPSYAPNEPDLQIASLKAFADSLEAANETAGETEVAYETALHIRDTHLYASNGLMATGANAKKYVKSVYSGSAAEYKKLIGLRFRQRPGFPPLSQAA